MYNPEHPIAIRSPSLPEIATSSPTDQELRDLPYLGCSYRGSFSMVEILGSIPDTVFLSQSSQGCDADFALVEDGFRRNSAGAASEPRLFGTDLSHSDVIMGIERRLDEAIDDLVGRLSPRAVFVRTKACMAGRSAWETQDEINQIRRRHRGTPILLARCDALDPAADRKRQPRLRDGEWVRVPGRRKVCGTVFNSIDFGRGRSFSRLLERTGLPWNPMEIGSSWDGWEKSGSASASFGLSSVEFGNSWGEMLSREWSVPFHRLPSPHGFGGTRAALEAVGDAVGEPGKLRWLAGSEEERWRQPLCDVRQRLRGKRILPLVADYWGDQEPVLAMLSELGVEVPGIGDGIRRWENLLGTTEEVESFYGENGLGLGRSGGYKLVGLVRELRPDAVVVLHNGIAPWCARMGIPVLEIRDPRAGLPFQGFEGLVRLGRKLADLCENPSLFRTLSRRAGMPYRREWLDTSLVREKS